MQAGGAEVHWPGFTHSILDVPCSSWPSSQLKMQTMPSGWGVTVETGEDREGLQLIWTPVGISGAGHFIAKKKKRKDDEMSFYSTKSENK